MYVQGVSTRKVKAVTEKLCGVSMSSTQVSHAAALLDAELEKWRSRPLGEYVYLYLDAYYEQVREDGQVRDLAGLKLIRPDFCAQVNRAEMAARRRLTVAALRFSTSSPC